MATNLVLDVIIIPLRAQNRTKSWPVTAENNTQTSFELKNFKVKKKDFGFKNSQIKDTIFGKKVNFYLYFQPKSSNVDVQLVKPLQNRSLYSKNPTIQHRKLERNRLNIV